MKNKLCARIIFVLILGERWYLDTHFLLIKKETLCIFTSEALAPMRPFYTNFLASYICHSLNFYIDMISSNQKKIDFIFVI